MKILRNVTAVTAALALSAGAFALPAVAQDGSEQTTTETPAADGAVAEDNGAENTEGDAAADEPAEQVDEADGAATTTAEGDEDRDFASQRVKRTRV